jgi:Glycosyl transferase family 2
MKIAVITPYHSESDEILNRCYQSVKNQTAIGICHYFVADGSPSSFVNDLKDVQHMVLNKSHSDAGATPRCIGSISAFSSGFDAVSFLDADNTYESTHIQKMMDTMTNNNADVVTATRNICDQNGHVLYIDRIESTGVDFCDTNCMFIGKINLHILTYWVTSPAYRLWSDRLFWNAIKQSNPRISHNLSPTVNYYSKWAWHYQYALKPPPANSVWIAEDTDGNLIHDLHINFPTRR